MLRPSDVTESARTGSQIYRLVSEFTVPIVGGLIVDWQFRAMPWGTVIGTAMGLVLGIVRIRSILKQLERQERKDREP